MTMTTERAGRDPTSRTSSHLAARRLLAVQESVVYRADRMFVASSFVPV